MAANCGEESSFPTSLSNHLRLHQRLGGECHHKIQLPHPELTTRRSNLRCHLKWKYQDVEETSPAINIDTMEQDADGADLLPDQAPESNKLYNSSNCQYFSTEQSPIIGWTCHKLKSFLSWWRCYGCFFEVVDDGPVIVEQQLANNVLTAWRQTRIFSWLLDRLL